MITSIKNPLVKQIRKLHRTKGRREQNLLLLEGTHLLQTACQANCSLMTLCFTEQWLVRNPQLLTLASQKAQHIELVTTEVLQSMATTVSPDGVIATMGFRKQTELTTTNFQLGLILEKLQDPGNLGTIIRTAVATEVNGIWLTGDSVEVDNPKVLRSSAGAWFHIPMMVSFNLSTVINNYQQTGVQVVATSPTATKPYWEMDLTKPTLILLGNEGAGLSQKLVTLADEIVSIPLGKKVESLNVAIACAILLYEGKRQRANA
ncbi:TrmH family RNA methyltransferase [Cyanobacterium sp. uoEpiScrs1]|uniref:TrmH family RNA methyltransferase n=1 Tax=Cyanobacterium sp. uoEpiScrs1 TaxID=2976343 RepID=UPI00226A4D73|nr:RNA methyltransferase [Cyanobacterium sp. uoEpiScrs1]